MTSKAAIGRAVRERLSETSLLSDISRSLRAIKSGRPLEAEPDRARKVRRVQALTGLARGAAEAVADYGNLNTMNLAAGERTGAEAIRGTTIDFVGAAFLAKGAQAARAVCRIAFREGPGEGTGFLISNRLLITNNHVIPSEKAAQSFFAEFDYELDLDRRPRPVTRFELDPAAFFLTDDEDDLDYTIVAIGKRASGQGDLAAFGRAPLSDAPDKHALGEFVNIVQHPDARLKEIVVRENALVARRPFALHYLADTEPGSSGSPVFNDQWDVIALHHWGVPHRELKLPDGTALNRDVNEGIRASAIVQELRTALRDMTGEKAKLLEAALQLGEESRQPEPAGKADHRPPSPGEAPAMTPSAPHANPAIGEDGSVTWHIPIQISVRIGQPGPAVGARTTMTPEDAGAPRIDAVAAKAGAPDRGSESVKPDKNYRKRIGYKANFLAGHDVPMPELSLAQKNVAAANLWARPDDDPHELKYTHFSVKMHGKRRLAFFTATNIDGKNWKSVNRKTGEIDEPGESQADGESPGGEAREPWFEDPRVEDSQETNDDLYLEQTIDGRFPGQLRIFERGHLTRRQDPAWGTDAQALAADADTFHFANCTPQIGFFNEGKSKREDEEGRGRGASGTLHWRAIEDYVLENAKAQDQKVCVFTGPVLNDHDDIDWRQDIIPGFKVPREFWKVVVRVENGKLRATALCADQSPLIDELPEARWGGFADLSKVKKYQLSIADLERKTGLDFGNDVRQADTAEGSEKRGSNLMDIGDLSL